MSPDGNIYWPGEDGDLSSPAKVGTFIHEMTHVMQYQAGESVLTKGFFLQSGKFLTLGLYDPYSFVFDASRPFSSYNIEHQGDIARGIYYGRYPNIIR